MASNSNSREVCVEVYVNGELYCIDSVEVPDEENVQVEFMVTDRIYELLACSPGDITAQLEVDTDECMTVSHAALEGEDLHINIEMKQPTCTCTTPENSPTESTTEWAIRKIGGFIQTLFWMNPAVPEPKPETAPVPEPEVNLVTVRWPAEEPGNEKNSPKRVIKKMSAFFQKYFPIDPAEPLCDPETEPELDVVESKESCDPVPSFPDTEPVSAEGPEADVSGDMDAEKMKKTSAFFQKYFPLDPPEPSCVPDASVPETEPVSPEGQEVDISDGMDDQDGTDASPEKIKKMKKTRAFFKKYFPLDPPEPSCDPAEPVSAEGQEVDVTDGMDASPETAEMNGPRESTTEWAIRKIGGFIQTLFWMDPVVPEPKPETAPVPEPEVNLVTVGWPAEEPGNEKNSPKREEKKMRAFFKKYFPLDPSEPSCVPDASVPETEPVSAERPETDLSDDSDDETMKEMSALFLKYFQLDPPELESEPDLDDSDDSCVPGPSSSVPKPYTSPSEQERSPEEHCSLLEKRVKGCTQRHRPITNVWNNIFIGNEEIARDRIRLKELGITHVLNAAAVKTKLGVLLGVPWEKDLREAVNTGAWYYRGMKISYCGLPASNSSDISKYFYKAAKFIRKAKKNPENKVFIHCTDGVSCAPTLFLAYLMIHHNMTVEDAIDYLIKVRYIQPDTEFLKQLAVLNQDLKVKQQLQETQAGRTDEVQQSTE